MLKRILGLVLPFSAAALLAACSNMSEYEQHVEDWEPVYCYKSIGAVQCYKEPKHSDSRRLVNFYGPPPRTYDKPDKPALSKTRPPERVDYWVKDAEPVPQANAPKAYVKNPEPAKLEAPEKQEAGSEDVSFMDNLMRFLSGKPQLANKPVAQVPATVPAAPDLAAKPLASAAAPVQPAPAAQPVMAVEKGTL